jgi:hypothetical protein
METLEARGVSERSRVGRVGLTTSQEKKLYYCIVDGLSYSTKEDVSAHLRFAHANERNVDSIIRERRL